MDRGAARKLAAEKPEKETTVRHLISVEGVMRALARRLDGDEDLWALTGLFHDLDQDLTGEDPERHAYIAADWLREAGVDERVINGVLAHAHEQYRKETMDRAIVHADAIAGLLRVRHKIQAGDPDDFLVRTMDEIASVRSSVDFPCRS